MELKAEECGKDDRTLAETLCQGDDTREGWLYKRGKVTQSWKRVHVSLKGNLLSYGKSEKKEEARKCLCLEGARVEECDEIEKSKFIIKIKPKAIKRVYYFRLESAEEYDRWLEAIFVSRISKENRSGNSEACSLQ